MAYFSGTVRGARGSSTRQASKKVGLRIEAAGKDVGVSVQLFHRNGKDQINIFINEGSEGGTGEIFLGTYPRDAHKLTEAPAQDITDSSEGG